MSLMRRIPFPQNLTRTVDRRPTRVAYALPTFFTAGNMFFGFVAVDEGVRRRDADGAASCPERMSTSCIAAQMIGLAVLLDGLDGRIARMTNTTSDFGREMDSMADAITFGVAPAVLAFRLGLSRHRHERQCVRHAIICSGSDISSAFCICLSGCARLARFNITTNPVPKNPGRPTASISSACRFLPRQDWSRRLCTPWKDTRCTGWPLAVAVARVAGTAGISDGLHVAVSQLQGSEPECVPGRRC